MIRWPITAGSVSLLLWIALVSAPAGAQEPVILPADQLPKVVPQSFYFEGLLAPTQMRNVAAVRFQGGNRHFMAGLVDTSGYASNIRSRYEGFLILDAPVTLGTQNIRPGAYGFGFSQDDKLNVYDLGGNLLHTIAAQKDAEAKSPRPLLISRSGNELRLYRGRTYVTVTLK